MRDAGWELERVELDEGDALPDARAFDAVVAMGGPMSVNDEAELPWLVDEKREIRAAVGAGVPFFGACLGSQLLASALGARVYAGPSPEVGLLPVFLTDDARSDPVFGHLPAELLTLQWHGDTFDLPDGAALLATSPLYPHQAFRVGETAYAVQFHLEVSAAMAQEWGEVPEYAASLERVLGPSAAQPFLARIAEHADEMRADGARLFERWLTLAATRAALGAGATS